MQIGLLEDDIAIQEMLYLVMRDEGYTVTIYPTAEECLRALGITGEQPQESAPINLLIVDLRLAKSVSGTTVIRQIRDTPRFHAMPIILTTAAIYVDTNELERLQVTLLEKPFDVDQVVEMIENLTHPLSRQNVSSSFP